MAEREPIPRVTCTQCQHFITDKIGSGQGLSTCAVQKRAKTEQEKLKLYIECGSKLCWGDGNTDPDRFCQHFVGNYKFVQGD